MTSTLLSSPEIPASNKSKPEGLLQELNDRYGLGLRVASSTLSPRKRRQFVQAGDDGLRRGDRIQSRFCYLFYKHQADLKGILRTFDEQAQVICRKWVHKPLSDSDLLPSTTAQCHATSSKERHDLQKALLGLLDAQRFPHAMGAATSATTPVAQSRDGAVANRPRTARTARTTKRSSDSDELPNTPSPKKARSSRSFNGNPDLDGIPVRVKAGSSSLASAIDKVSKPSRTHENRSFTASSTYTYKSFNTSKDVHISDVFSQPQDDGSFLDSQTTVEATPRSARHGRDLDGSDDDPSEQYDVSPNFDRSISESFAESTCQTEIDQLPVLQNGPLGLDNRPRGFDPPIGDIEPDIDYCHDSHVGSYQETGLEENLKNIWPPLPPFLNHAPLAICWEVTRIALHCGVSLDNLEMEYDSNWKDQKELRKALWRHPSFAGKAFPASCDPKAWVACLERSFRGEGSYLISLVADLSWNESTELVPLFKVSLQPFKFETGHRLGRQFGSDRMLEINFPSPTTGKRRPSRIRELGEVGEEAIIRWIATERHFMVGRRWAAFYTRGAKKMVMEKRNTAIETEAKEMIHLERVFCFAEDGNSFCPRICRLHKHDTVDERTKVELSEMLAWAINPFNNTHQPFLKLFSRIPLSLSRTHPTVILEPHQIRHRLGDIRSEAGNVMNDGIARMSPALARKVCENLPDQGIICGFQGRFGSAKGFWIIDVGDSSSSEDIWIETYPSQRKWVCDYDDVNHRTFEVKSTVRELKSANVNLQFIVVLVAQAKNADRMRETMQGFLVRSLEEELARLRSAMDQPTDMYGWVHENYYSSYRWSRLKDGIVEYLGGFPNADAERIIHLLCGGFRPMEQKYLRELCRGLVEKKCDLLRMKLNIKIPRSTYAFMVVDFSGLLKPGQVHFGFSTKFKAEQYEGTLLNDVDVLVARAPAHFPSDIQRVKAVFCPGLADLKDVIVFPSTGEGPLADILSGGDYDGDQAWVCWEPDIVNNFENSDVPVKPDLVKLGYLSKKDGSFQDLHSKTNDKNLAVSDFMFESFKFNMQEQLLGHCTSWKESYCYHRNSINGEGAILLSTLLGQLVDQPKQGIVFTKDDWARLRRENALGVSGHDPPAYKNMDRPPTSHVLDYLTFEVAKKTIGIELTKFHISLGESASYWDSALAGPYNEFDAIKEFSSASIFEKVQSDLYESLKRLRGEWCTRMNNRSVQESYAEKVRALHVQYLNIEPCEEAKAFETMRVHLGTQASDPELSKWGLLKASTLFRIYHHKGNAQEFIWSLAGRQLCWLKAVEVEAGAERDPYASRKIASAPFKRASSRPMAVVSYMAAVMKPDRGTISGLMAKKRDRVDGESVVIEEVEFDDDGTQIDDA